MTRTPEEELLILACLVPLTEGEAARLRTLAAAPGSIGRSLASWRPSTRLSRASAPPFTRSGRGTTRQRPSAAR